MPKSRNFISDRKTTDDFERNIDVALQYAYRPEIDGLRALAVVSVIINHFNKGFLPNGYLGVDIFFVISGYVITSSLCNSQGKKLIHFLLDFYTRRLKRLVPALLVCVVVTSVLICFFNPTPELSLKTGITSLFGLSNLYLLRHSTDYFAPSTELNVFTHTWSLGVEEQYYLVFPLLLWFSAFGRASSRWAQHLYWMVGLLLIASLFVSIYLNGTDQPAAFFLMPSRFWELGMGCLLFLLIKEKTVKGTIISILPLALLCVLIGILFIPSQSAILATIGVVCLTVLLIATLGSQSAGYKLFTHPRVVYIGLISYSLYLWHWSILSISRWTIGINWWSIPFQVLLILLLAVASYQYVEKPLRRAKWSAFRWISISYGIGASVIGSVLLIILLKPLEGHLYLGKKELDKINTSSEVLVRYSDVTQNVKDLITKCNMTPHYLSGKDYRPQPLVNSDFLRDCVQSPNTLRKMLLVGDSFAQVSASHLAVMAHRLGFEFRTVFGYDCPYPLLLKEIKFSTSKECKDVNEQLLWEEIIHALGEGDLLVVRLYLPKSEYLEYGYDKLPPADAYDKAFSKLIAAVQSKGAKLLIIGSNPTLTDLQQQSLKPQWFNLALSRVDIHPFDNQETIYYHLIDDHLRQYFAGLRGAYYFSLKPYLCDTHNICKLTNGNKLLYFDSHHLTPYGYDLFFDDLLKKISEIRSKN